MSQNLIKMWRKEMLKRSLVCYVLVSVAIIILCVERSKEAAKNRRETVTSQEVTQLEPEIVAQSAGHTYGDIQISRITHIYDGDTFNVDIDKWPTIVGKNIGIRINGIDTPEKTDHNPKIRRLSQSAKSEVESMLNSASTIELRNIHRDKYFRINADVFADDIDVGQKLIDKGLAKPYDGGKKSVWTNADCDKYFNGK